MMDADILPSSTKNVIVAIWSMFGITKGFLNGTICNKYGKIV